MTTLETLETRMNAIDEAMDATTSQDEYEALEDERGALYDKLLELGNTQAIKIARISYDDYGKGMIHYVTHRVHLIQGCVAAEVVDCGEWLIHHVPSGCWVGVWRGARADLPAFLSQCDTLLSPVHDPYDEAPDNVKALKVQMLNLGLQRDFSA